MTQRRISPADGLVVCALALCLFFASPAAAESYSRVFTFGDSYSDTGNWIRVSNGPVWIEYLCELLALPGCAASSENDAGDNYAVAAARAAGTRVIDLDAQLARYLARHPSADPRALYVLFIGFNDLEPQQDGGAAAVAAIVAAIDRLAASGALHFLVVDFWNKGVTPRYLARDDADRIDLVSQALWANLSLAEALVRRRESIAFADVFGLATQVWMDPEAFGFEDASGHCAWDAVCEGYAYWDDIHPSTAFHALIAHHVLDALLARVPGPPLRGIELSR